MIVQAVAKEDTSVLLANADWKKDMGERSRRVYDWWQMLLNEKSGSLPKCEKAVKLLALVQVSSAFVERVFFSACLCLASNRRQCLAR